MITVGYGDITPSNVYEVLFVTISMYTACALFSYAVSSFSFIVSEIKKHESEFGKEMRNVILNFLLFFKFFYY